jgi:acyl-CoA hydrolase
VIHPLAEIDFAALIRPGETVLIGEGAGEPTTLADRIVAQRDRLAEVRLFLGMTIAGSFRLHDSGGLSLASYGALGDNRALAAAGLLEIVPVGLGQIPALLERGAMRFDVVVIAVPPAVNGRHSLGLTALHLPAAIRKARLVIAEVNHALPCVPGVTIGPEEIDIAIETDRVPPTLTLPPPSDTVQAIARNVARHVGDGATLQLGVGGVPEALCAELRDRRDLGVHSGLLGPGLARLIRDGVATGARYSLLPGKAVIGAVMGDAALYDFVRDNDALHLAGVEITHGHADMIDNLVSINGALQVDLTGQVNAEAVGGRPLGAIGGQAEFCRAAARSPLGRSIIALSATSPDGSASNITAAPVERVTTPRYDVDIVATEFGCAELTGADDAERRRRLIAIADPRFRERLEWESRG